MSVLPLLSRTCVIDNAHNPLPMRETRGPQICKDIDLSRVCFHHCSAAKLEQQQNNDRRPIQTNITQTEMIPAQT